MRVDSLLPFGRRKSTPESDKEGQSTDDTQIHAPRSDPRRQILEHFDTVAPDNVFTVWRPTSAIAIKRMIDGEATGKGLECKGKSSKAGRLSGFIPYLQIHEEEHKSRVATLHRGGRTRIFYRSQETRDQVLANLEPIQNHVLNAVQDAKRTVRKMAMTLFYDPFASSVRNAGSTTSSSFSNVRNSGTVKALDEAVTDVNTTVKGGIKKLAKVTHIDSFSSDNKDKSKTSPMTSSMKKLRKPSLAFRSRKGGEEHQDDQEFALKRLLWDMDDPSIRPVDDYAPQCYGIELPDRLLWKAFVVDRDISRPEDTDLYTGRQSIPAFQDMNFIAISKTRKNKNDEARVVLWQEFIDDGMDPRGLILAYEEGGRVLPIVSDFDCFTMGTRDVRYGTLPEDQVELLEWCVTQIESVLDEKNDGSSSWTSRWLDVLKANAVKGFHPNIPRYGFGDTFSYGVIESAVRNLKETGAVRHGAECFNFYFPQDLDKEFLIISRSLPAPGWRHVDQDELKHFLMERIEEGFAFPVNPKWVLCDHGWKEIYDRLIHNEDPVVQAAMNHWFPEDSCVRSKIESVHLRHPDGFIAAQSNPEVCDTEAMDLATLELERYMTLRRAKVKLRTTCTMLAMYRRRHKETMEEEEEEAKRRADEDTTQS